MARILFTSTYFYPYISGLAEYPLKIGEHLAKTNQVNVLTYRYDNKLPDSDLKKSLNIYRLPVHLKIFKGLWNFYYPFIALKKVIQSDVVFINLPQFEGVFPAFFSRITGKKTYCIFNCELFFNEGFWAKSAAMIGNLSAIFTCLFSQKIIVNTRDYANNSSILKYFKNKTLFIFPPVEKLNIDKNYYRFLKNKYLNNNLIIGFAGRVTREKGLDYLLAAVNELKKDYPKITVLIAGPNGNAVVGEEDYFKKIKKILDKFKLKVVFLGFLDKNKLFSFYKTIDLLVLPSTNKTESFGMVQVEAMLSGKPVVASGIPGVRTPVLLTGMGELTKPKDATDLAAKIIKVAKNINNYKKNHKKAVNTFDVKKTYQFYENLI